MRFTYDSTLNSLSIVLSDNEPVLHQTLISSDKILIELDEDGGVCRVQVDEPSRSFYSEARDIVANYKLSIEQGFFLLLVSDQTGVFNDYFSKESIIDERFS